MKKSKEERGRMHDKIQSSQERWVDPWLWQFRLHDECECWRTVWDLSLAMGNDLERPKPGKKHRYK